MKFRQLFCVWGFAFGLWLVSTNSVHAQVTAFTYQGTLSSNGVPANGQFAMQFKLRLPNNAQVGSTLTNAPVGVTNGLFTTQLDFGNVFLNNATLYLEIGVIPYGSSSAFTILSPTTLLTPVPYAEDAYAAATYTGTINDTQLSTNIPELNMNQTFGGTVNFLHATGTFNGSLLGTLNATGTFSGASSGTFTGTFTGNGGAVTNLNVTNLVGVVQSNPNWQLIQGTSQAAVSGNNYLTTNASLSTLTLPSSPNVGSTVYISGSGANGWALSQNSGQSILTGTLGLPAGLLWNGQTNGVSYFSVASSAGGIRLAAGVGGGGIYYSADGGHTFALSDAPTSKYWISIASSADGLRMVAVSLASANIYTSTNGGTNWVAQGGSTAGIYHRVASSANGLKLAAASDIGSGNMYLSTDGGLTWNTPSSGFVNNNFSGIASSADGTKLYACSSNTTSRVYVSADSGMTWTNLGPTNSFSAITCSADGVHVAVASPNTSIGGIYVSDDSGNTWTQRAFADTWSGISCSSNAAYYVATTYHGGSGYIYTSGDAGVTWVQRVNGIPSGESWNGVASSGDGARILASTGNGQLWTAQATTTVSSGGLTGTQYSSLELQYIGNGQWMPLNSKGSFSQY